MAGYVFGLNIDLVYYCYDDDPMPVVRPPRNRPPNSHPSQRRSFIIERRGYRGCCVRRTRGGGNKHISLIIKHLLSIVMVSDYRCLRFGIARNVPTRPQWTTMTRHYKEKHDVEAKHWAGSAATWNRRGKHSRITWTSLAKAFPKV